MTKPPPHADPGDTSRPRVTLVERALARLRRAVPASLYPGLLHSLLSVGSYAAVTAATIQLAILALAIERGGPATLVLAAVLSAMTLPLLILTAWRLPAQVDQLINANAGAPPFALAADALAVAAEGAGVIIFVLHLTLAWHARDWLLLAPGLAIWVLLDATAFCLLHPELTNTTSTSTTRAPRAGWRAMALMLAKAIARAAPLACGVTGSIYALAHLLLFVPFSMGVEHEAALRHLFAGSLAAAGLPAVSYLLLSIVCSILSPHRAADSV